MNSCNRIHDIIFQKLKDTDCYERVFATRNYGYLLAKNEQTRLEGQDLIQKADLMQQGFPFWAERKMCLFVPVMTMVDESQFGF